MPAAVIDANVVIGLAMGGVFQFLASLYAPLYVPAAVVHEVITYGRSRPGAAELAQALGQWITEVTPALQVLQQFPATLPLADRQVLAVARQEAVAWILTGDEGLIQAAARHGLACLRSSEVVVLLKQHQFIPAAKPILDRMRQAGFGLDDVLYRQALQDTGDTP